MLFKAGSEAKQMSPGERLLEAEQRKDQSFGLDENFSVKTIEEEVPDKVNSRIEEQTLSNETKTFFDPSAGSSKNLKDATFLSTPSSGKFLLNAFSKRNS